MFLKHNIKIKIITACYIFFTSVQLHKERVLCIQKLQNKCLLKKTKKVTILK